MGVLTITLYPRDSECCNCGQILVEPDGGLPCYEGVVVPADDPQSRKWGGFDACKPCWDLYSAGLLDDQPLGAVLPSVAEA